MEEATLKQTATTGNKADDFTLRYLPDYAKFLKDQCLVPYIQEQIRISRELNLPMLKFFKNIPDAELVRMSIESHNSFLDSAAENNLKEHLERSLKVWAADQLGIMKKEEITLEDIIQAGYVRKKALLKFIPAYTSDVNEVIEIIKEVDAFTVKGDIAATNIYTEINTAGRQKMLLELIESRDLYKKAQALAHIGNWSWDLISGQIEWSEELYNIYGIPQGTEVKFDEIMALNHPDDNSQIKYNLKQNIETLKPRETYYRAILKDGTRKILHAKTEALTGNDGKASKLIGIIQDVTEKQLLIERLQESETLYKQAQAISRIGNWSWDIATKRLDWSDELYHIYELAPQSVDTSATLAIYNHPQDAALVRDTIKHSIETLEPFDFDYRIILKNGDIKILNARGEIGTGADKKPVKIYGTVQDITGQKIVEKQLKDTREFIQKITDTTPSVIASYNIHTGKYTFINKSFETKLGFPLSRVMEEGVAFFSSIIHPDDLASLMERNAKALEDANMTPCDEGEPIVEFKYRMKNARGEYRWFHTYGTVFERDEKGMVESVLNISLDITEQEEAEHALFQKNLEIQQSNTSLEEYAYVASHDLKEPLRKIVIFSDRILLSQEQNLDADGKTYLNKIIDSSRRMQKMINDLLYVSTISGNKDFRVCDLNIILQDAIAPLDHKIEELQGVIEAGKLPVISVVPTQFTQLFQNLISNSLKFVRKGITPNIKITSDFINYRPVDQPNLKKVKKYLQIEFRDNGIGFDDQYAGRIFGIFQRLHGKAEYEGSGIGLAVCKKIVENHGGVITAKGQPEVGTVFTIIIPA